METRIAQEAAAAALADIGRTQMAAGRRRQTPWWYWHLFGGVQVVMMAVLMLVPDGVRSWLVLPIVAAGFGIQAVFDRVAPGRMFTGSAWARTMGIVYGVAVIAVLAGALIVMLRTGSDWPLWVAVIALYGLTVWLGPLSERNLDRPDRPVVS